MPRTESRSKYLSKWYAEHKEYKREYSRQWSRRLKSKVIEHYGGKCICCGETILEFLSVDHTNNDGATHRKKNKTGSGHALYSWIVKNDYPDYFQVMCYNCNLAKGFYGFCPHEKQTAEAEGG